MTHFASYAATNRVSKFINRWQKIEWLKLEAWYFALIDLQICYTGAGTTPKFMSYTTVLVWDFASREENTWEVRVSKQGTLTQLINYEKEESLAAIFVYTEQTNFWFLKGFCDPFGFPQNCIFNK